MYLFFQRANQHFCFTESCVESHVSPSDPAQFPGIHCRGPDLQPSGVPIPGHLQALPGPESLQNCGHLE